jgi:aldehyde:ferredoxin oxidoreductase
MDAMILCRFTNFAWTVDDYAEFLSAGTGLSINGRELLEIGERIYNLERIFNNREGLTAKDDQLPPRFFSPLPEGNSRERVVELDTMLAEYYSLRGWDKEGKPSKDRIKKLKIDV